MLKVQHLNFAFGHQVILNDLSFTLPDGSITGLVAPNGTGKTTLLRCLCGLLPSGPQVMTLNGIDLYQKRKAYLGQLFFLENSNQLYADLTVIDHLKCVRKMWHSSVDLQTTIASLGMNGYAKKRIRDLSLGMKQHALLAMYLVADAQLMLIDEPLNGLDPTSIRQFERIFAEQKAAGKTLLVSSHQMDSVARVSDDVFFLKDQKILAEANTGQDMMAEYGRIFLGEQAHA
ncbi:ATP-binding cassette domain-containing protein [Lacticaseibacillus suilingensis]|uniref:ATP-binding cassette domain-containing protein n=1 Tax=Lacticaseibacillus suilingensis TaxID=2799577 RepID=A0ABW4BDT7_9LACO|nr:ATP-binding cassette domain-containing protein [Lacticaseibacillus suilingensis]